MGVDIAVCFALGNLDPKIVIQSQELSLTQNSILYFAYWINNTLLPNISHFAIWEEMEDSVKLVELCKEISNAISPICIAWKSEHGGIGGYYIFTQGTITEKVEDIENYSLLPIVGFRKAFGFNPVREDEELSFPEICLDTGSATCLIVDYKEGNIRETPNSTVIQLLEHDIDAEIVLP
jgi:hypothetical protein